MFFCRVIMGNMELIHPGSKQFLPSSSDFDSGVDDLQEPRHYIVWNTNMNTHIYPEYVVSFKVTANAEGDMQLLKSLLFIRFLLTLHKTLVYFFVIHAIYQWIN